MIGADIRHFVFLANAEHTLKIVWRMLSISLKGPKAWDIQERVFYRNQTCTYRWLGLAKKNEIL
jgi:hypothetical protein